ncbi:MAG: hypothetical protein KJ583_05125 [Nanoarchaeota archaeon]|nr:hypothetical protein [Nanoarchaeota archaeon]MBU1270356.1 hypothetical protein [Nanoarchaeota archaeon]MBU1604671.1 hypothetical protein [Nanoarchaeota archaeon]MBU2443353.1 hypothetical protein [Nanoarchaeota archaeon]
MKKELKLTITEENKISLQLNNPVAVYKEFYGKNIDKMPELIASGFTPMTFADVMKRRLEVLGGNKDVADAWWDNYFDTVNIVAYHPDGRIKIVLDSQLAKEINPKSTVRNGSIVLPNTDAYEQLAGQEFTQKEIEKYAKSESLTLKQALSNPIWAALANDPKLHEEYAKATFKEAKEKYGFNNNLGVYLSGFKEVPNFRLWLSSRLNYNSDADGSNSLDYNYGRLVGVAPEAHGAEKIAMPTLEQIMNISSKYVAPVNVDALRKDLKGIYK